ncbi:MAG: hypothetical protein JXR18_05620 [Neptuniibacter sp.]
MNISKQSKLMKKSMLAAGIALALTSTSSYAINLYDKDGTTLDFNGLGLIGAFSSDQDYYPFPSPESSPSWQEATITYGLYANKQLDNNSVYGGLAAISTWVGGDGDAAGVSSGNESSKTDIEEAFAGIRGDGWDFSFGQQGFKIGTGFLMWDDGFNPGDFGGAAPELNRGGTYWMGGASRKSFDETAILRLGYDEGFRGDIFWLQSGNKAQAETELAGFNIEHNSEMGQLGLTYLKGLDVTPSGALFGSFDNPQRDGQETISVRYQGSAGVENLSLAAEFVDQDQGDNSKDANAWYAEAGWSFADTAWAPLVSYRYSTFDENFDFLFYGASQPYGTWFQGEIAGNYAGPVNTNADIQHLSAIVHPSPVLRLGASYFNFDDNSALNNDGDEVNLWAEWVVNDNLIVSPLVGFYKPDSAVVQGNTDTNTHFQLIAIVPF